MVDHSQVTSSISPEERAERNGHTGRILWLTGLSGAGMPAGKFTEVYVST